MQSEIEDIGNGLKRSKHRYKRDAIAAVKAHGFTQHIYTSQCGDHAHGSREYFARPGAKLNDHGWPFVTAQADMMRRGFWYATWTDRADP